MRIVIGILFLTLATSAYAQPSVWGRVDTVTSGDSFDMNPRLDSGGLYSDNFGVPFEWLVFERMYNGGLGPICAVRIQPSASNSSHLQFDSVVVISPDTNYYGGEHPDVSTEFSSKGPVTLAAWEEIDPKFINYPLLVVWTIFYSYTSGNETRWSTPQMIPGLGQYPPRNLIQNLIVRPLSDSSFILLWRDHATIMFSTFLSGQMSSPDTLVATNYDSTEFDFAFITHPNPTIVWTGKDSTGKVVCFAAQVMNLNPVELSKADTISSDGNISDPRFMNSFAEALTFNVDEGGRFKAVLGSYDSYSNTWSQQNLASDSLSDNLNAVGVSFPIAITDAASPAQNEYAKTSSVLPGFFAWERRSRPDTTLVFAPMPDTVRSNGINRNPYMTTYTFSDGSDILFPCVWESNRTGRIHIYAMVGSVSELGVNETPYPKENFVLLQNYPDPFNPTTVITYEIAKPSNVSLTVYDVLGRQVATLVNAKESAGEHVVRFDGSRFASGVYFYRIKAGEYRAVKKMLLLK